MMIVLDTSALLFWTLDPDRLTGKAKNAITNAEKIAISSISVWEIGLKVKRGQLEMPISVNEFANRLEQLDKFEIIPVDVSIWLENLALKWEHRDPADRTIVAMSQLMDCPLVTSDKTIAAYYGETIW